MNFIQQDFEYIEPIEKGITVVKKRSETTEELIKRFKKKYSKSGINKECRDRMYYDKPNVKKRKKRAAAERVRIREEEKRKKQIIKLKKIKKDGRKKHGKTNPRSEGQSSSKDT